ncbi:hypothetical protein WMF39_40725 [Sorangium sp. So ce1504]|uniref:hypothetical protein n=1 Tax=Sorangium sp. So ce1504 TaxID=3133337 RepID=UPI003F5F3F00
MTLLSTLDEFAEDLRQQLVAALAGMGFAVPAGLDANEACIILFKVLGRTIPMRSRIVKRSRELNARDLTTDQVTALQTIEAESLGGLNLNHRLTRKFWNADFDDLLLNDWSIQHLHLGPPGGGPKGLSGGMKELLFVMVRPDELYFIDLLDHDAFAEQQLVEIVHANWPELLNPYRIRATLHFGPQPTPEERKEARKAGLTMFLQMKDGTNYRAPGGGQATSRDSIRAVEQADAFRTEVVCFHGYCSKHVDEIARHFRATTSREPSRFRLFVDLGNPQRIRLMLRDQSSGILLE